MRNNSRVASRIMSEICDFLQHKGVSVDSKERLQAVAESNSNLKFGSVSPIYGCDYIDLHKRIEDILTTCYGEVEVKGI